MGILGLTALSGIVAILWMSDRDDSSNRYRHLVAETKPKGSGESKPASTTKSAKESVPSEEVRLKLNYYSASWPRVFQDLATAGNKEFICDKYPSGRFSRVDKTDHLLKDAIRIVNHEIERQGLRLIEKGDYLILIDTVQMRAEYPPAVLPAKKSTGASPKSADVRRDRMIEPARSRGETISAPRKGDVDSAHYEEEVDSRSNRQKIRQLQAIEADGDDADDRPLSARQILDSRKLRQPAEEDLEVDSDRGSPERSHPVSGKPTSGREPNSERTPHLVFKPRHQTALDLAKRVYRAMSTDAELVDAARNELPGFRVVNPQFVGTDSSKSKKQASHAIEFMVSIDESRNELLIDGTAKDASAVVKLLRTIDKPADEQIQTYIKPSTRYVCQVADQLPAEIDRIRAAGNGRAVARRTDSERPVTVADEDGRKVPAPRDNGARRENPVEEAPNDANPEFDEAIGNFKGEVNIEVIDDLNVMIIRGNEGDVDQIMKVIERIEKLSIATAPRIHRLNLNNVDSVSLAELLVAVYEKLIKFPGGATQPRESVAIIPVAKPNAILIVAPEADLETIIDLADQLDQPVDPQTEFEVFPLKSAIATDVETMLNELYKEPKSMSTKVLIIADSHSNALIVRARTRDLEEIKALIKKVDRDDVGSVNQVKIFTLKNAVATDIAAVITSAIQSVLSPPRAISSGQGGQQGNTGLGGGQVEEQFRSAKSTVLQFLATDKESARMIRSGILSDIRITPDLHSNSLIVTASDKSMELLSALIQQLDRPTNTVSVIKVFTLENADATLMVQQLNALFNNVPQGQNQNRILPGLALVNADDASSSLVPLKFSVDTRTNSVIAVGSSDAMGVVEAVLRKLDESNLRSRQNKVIRLNNAPALQISTAITAFFQQQRDLTQNDPNLVSNVEQLEREVIVIPDTISNNLLVSATPRYFPDILQMIAKLDSVPKVVVIQAMIVEVQLNNTDEFGIELGVQSPVFFDRSVLDDPVVLTTTTTELGQQTTTQMILSQSGSPGFNFNNSGIPLGNNLNSSPGIVGGQSLTNFSMGRANSDLGTAGWCCQPDRTPSMPCCGRSLTIGDFRFSVDHRFACWTTCRPKSLSARTFPPSPVLRPMP
jgi:type II secretory pathway component GspD/PulD (secretin)